MTYAYAFLREKNAEISEKQIQLLEDEYVKFVNLCTDALDINLTHLTNDKNGAELMYHESLKNGLNQIKTELIEMGLSIEPPSVDITI